MSPYDPSTGVDIWGDELRAITPSPKDLRLSDKWLSSTFGMSEMESAALVIIEKAKAAGSWNVHIHYSDFQNLSFRDHSEMVGFCHLLNGKWLKPSHPNGNFVVTQAFVDRIDSRGSLQ